MNNNYFKSAVLNHSQGNWNKAKEIYEHILKSDPNNYTVLQNYASLLSQLREFKLAKITFEKCLKINPKDSLLVYNYGKFFHDQNNFDRAINCYEKSFKLNSKNDMSLYNIGNIFLLKNNFQKAITYFKKVLEINSSHYLAYNNIGIAHKRLGNFGESVKFYRKAIEKKTNYVDAHLNLGTMLLTIGNLKEGFEEYEWRKKSKSFSDYINYRSLDLKTKVWEGQNLDNKTILIIAEQGIGDLIQFSRYLYLIKDKYKTNIILKIKNKQLSHFFSQKNFKIVSDEQKIPEHDYHIFLLSLPRVFFKTDEIFYKPVNFFQEDKKAQIKWEEKIASLKKLKIGIHWKTSSLIPERDLPFVYFEKLSQKIDADFVVLQKDIKPDENSKILKNKKIKYFPDIDSSQKPFVDSIEIIKKLDLVITSDTAISHLSATLGKNTWIILPFVADWRWARDKENSSWYPNVLLFRQKKIGEWQSVFDLLEKKLQNFK